jgi:hypothetical protein
LSDYAEFEIAAVLNNVMIIDQLFKANGNIHKICLDMTENDEAYRDEYVNGFCFSRDPDDYSFYLYSQNFRIRIEDQMISFFYGDLGIQFKTKSLESIDNFKILFIALVNMNSDQNFENIDQFVDLYNMVHI